ncbi:MAG: ABC transporter ATP-binding protein [Dehalococcoidaceae bacterium]|nr:ABC transporter ATP-binding protein [Dehalococcoidaceae bacterium]
MTAISTQNLSKYYKDVKALDGLNLEVPENVIFGFLGPNGAGKTTAVKLLTGFAHPTAGDAWVAGEKVSEGNLALQSLIGLLPDVPAFYDWMSAREFMHFVGEIHRLEPPEITSRTTELLKLVGLERDGSRRVGGYSRGMRQRLGIAQALINRPKVIFMDEPTSALDPVGKREVLELIKELKQTATVFMSTHNLAEVERVCDMVGIINRGRLVTVSSVESLQKKYARSLFEMEFLEDAAGFMQTLKQTPWLAEPEIIMQNGSPVIRVKAGDVEFARKELPRLIGESGLTLARYELVLPSLEDVFVEILSEEVSR